MTRKLKNTLRKFDKEKENKPILISGELGIPLNGTKTVEVPNRRAFVFVRLKGNTSELIQAYNASVSPIYGLPVLVGRQGNVYKVVGRNLDRYQDWGNTPYLPKHGAAHSFNHDLGIGGDVVWVYSQQFMPLLNYPSGSSGGMTLSLEPHFYEWNGQWKYAQNTGTPSYTPYLPTVTGSARMVLSYIDPVDNSVKLVPGTPFSGLLTGSADIAQYIPDIPREIGLPLSAVRLTTGTTAISWDAIYDLRDFYTVGKPSGSAGGAGGGFGIVGQDEGIFVATGTVLNVTGAGATLTAVGTVFNLNVPGGGVGAGVVGWDEGVPLATGTTVNVTSPLLNLSASGTVLNLTSTFCGIRAYHTGTTQVAASGGSGTAIQFNAEVFDTNNFHSTTATPEKFYFPIAGKYHFGGQFYADPDCDIRLTINGTKIIAFGRQGAGAAAIVGYDISTIYSVATGSYVEVVAVGQGGARNVYTDGEASPIFWMYYLGP